ncbi:MAG: SDR family NAD(P)-dependent oxidoreductase [Desulfobacterales bacterium]|nr:MAG: SDR family NAD(P)-dependent oxidoreductase [Desulfobacterales bacterium]
MLQKPVVIVTGASRGLGAAVAGWLAKAGTAVTLLARSEENLNKVAEDVRQRGGEPLVCRGDVVDYDRCLGAVENTLKRFGRIDALVNNAGIVQPISAVAQSDPADWRYNIEVNLIGSFNLIRAAVSALRRQDGRIVNVSSGAANLALENISAYCAAKAALNHFSRVMAAEEAALTVLAVRPGVVDTDMQAYIREEGPKSLPADQAAYYQQLKDRGELEPPEIPARSIAWLALHAPRQFSGRFLDYDDPHVSRSALEVFGESLI